MTTIRALGDRITHRATRHRALSCGVIGRWTTRVGVRLRPESALSADYIRLKRAVISYAPAIITAIMADYVTAKPNLVRWMFGA